MYFKRQQIRPGFIQQIQQVCPKCKGKGKIIKHQCHVCHGKKLLNDLETFQVEITKGAPYGEKVVLAGSAQDYIDQNSSDLIFVLEELEHAFYKRKGVRDLEAQLTISLKEALMGFKKKIRTLDDRLIWIKNEGVT